MDLKPISLNKLREKDPELYRIIMTLIDPQI